MHSDDDVDERDDDRLLIELLVDTSAPAAEETIGIAEMAAQVAAIAPVTPPPAANDPTRVRIKMRYTPNSPYPIIESQHLLPSARMAAMLLPKEYHKYVTGRYAPGAYSLLPEYVGSKRSSIPLQVWAQAIGEATLRQMACSEREATADISHVAQGGYLAIGDSLYQLHAVGHVTTNKAMAAVKKRITDKATAEAEVIKQSADAASQAILAVAREERNKAEELLMRARVEVPPPQWAIAHNVPMRKLGGHWEVMIRVGIRFSHWVTGIDTPDEVRWETPVEAFTNTNPIRCIMWVPLDKDGNYSQTAVRLDDSSPLLPHMTRQNACMGLGDAPARITEFDHLQRLQHSIARCFTTINFDSLFNSVDQWWKIADPFVPAALRDAVMVGRSADRVWALARAIRLERARVAAEVAAAATRDDVVVQEIPPALVADVATEAPETDGDVWTVSEVEVARRR